MYQHHNTLFYGEFLSKEYESRSNTILSAIENEDDNYVLNVSETEYMKHLLSVHGFCMPIIIFDEVFVEDVEENIPIEMFPNHFLYSNPPKFIKKQVVKYQIPCEGDIELLYYRPSTIMCSMPSNIKLSKDKIVIEINNFNNNID